MRGFSLIELSVVLIVIGMILGAVSIGKDVHRAAQNQRIASEFVQGWLIAYDNYVTTRGAVPGDNAGAPSGCVNGKCATGPSAPGDMLCETDLRDAMLAAGVSMPSGRSEGLEDHYVYLDTNGLPHDLQICFRNVMWSERGAASTDPHVARRRNVMVLGHLTPSLATFLDHYIDTVIDARFGDFREDSKAALTTTEKQVWSIDDTRAMKAGTPDGLDESQVAEVTAWMKMVR
jgi:prepilin-type N-terminal cleavage/methylation domain-containing protein